MKGLHWLPVKHRIEYKMLVLTYNIIHNNEPSYLKDLITYHEPGRSLRSSSTVVLKQPVLKSKFSERSFSVSAPKLWNSLSVQTKSCTSIHQFKTMLKTELFRRAYLWLIFAHVSCLFFGKHCFALGMILAPIVLFRNRIPSNNLSYTIFLILNLFIS